MNAPSVSVVVPVYNVAAYLPRCLDSLVAQTLDDVEFILVNDGSTDESGRILRDYAARDPRFRVIEQENRGYSGARIAGMAQASGEYLGFADGDDWVEPEMYRKLLALARAEGADIAQCSYNYCYDQGLVLPYDNSALIALLARSGGRLEGAEALIFDNGTVWNRLYRRSMLLEHGLSFNTRMAFGEDVYFYWTTLCTAGRVAALPDPLYNYRQQVPNSQTASGDRRNFAYFTVFEEFDRFIGQRGLERLRPYVNHLKLSFLCYGYGKLQAPYRDEYFERFCQYFQDCGLHRSSPIARGCLAHGGAAFRLRYLLLQVLHPLTLRALLDRNRSGFDRIIRLREFLATAPVRLAKWRHARASGAKAPGSRPLSV